MKRDASKRGTVADIAIRKATVDDSVPIARLVSALGHPTSGQQVLVKRAAHVLVVTSGNQRADAHAFYENCGYAFTGRRYRKSAPLNGCGLSCSRWRPTASSTSYMAEPFRIQAYPRGGRRSV